MPIGPMHPYIFRILYDDGTNKQVEVYDWNRGGAWATLCRDVNKRDHGDVRTVVGLVFCADGEGKGTKG